MKIVILHQTISNYDAIGNDIYHMHQILKKYHECYVFSEYVTNPNLQSISRYKLLKLITDKHNIIIYHHSIYWEEGESLLNKAKAKIVIKYHNITPESFFENYNSEYYRKCKLGREQTIRFYNKFKKALWLSDSIFNLQEINLQDIENKSVVPPFNNLGKWDGILPNDKILKSLIESKNINLLFVGRVVPNKAHKFLIKIVKDYINNYDLNICLNIIGKKDNSLLLYNGELENMLDKYNLNNHVKFIEEIDDNSLLSYYLGSDFFLCCSEHEGFCIPLIEAQFTHLPIIAKNTGVIKETIGPNQLLLKDDIKEYSSAIKILSERKNYRNFLIENGFLNYFRRFQNTKISDTFINSIKAFTSGKI